MQRRSASRAEVGVNREDLWGRRRRSESIRCIKIFPGLIQARIYESFPMSDRKSDLVERGELSQRQVRAKAHASLPSGTSRVMETVL